MTLSAGNTGCNYDLFSWVAERPVSTAIDDVIAERPESQDKAYYDLMGRRYERPTQPGIYIHQGKKVVVK
ncbi:alpha amylase catalytic domain protein [Prevotella sp. CAG:755]|nr:alpha amylase catalytic domain protein [Prevotella sp. CAG:755]